MHLIYGYIYMYIIRILILVHRTKSTKCLPLGKSIKLSCFLIKTARFDTHGEHIDICPIVDRQKPHWTKNL